MIYTRQFLLTVAFFTIGTALVNPVTAFAEKNGVVAKIRSASNGLTRTGTGIIVYHDWKYIYIVTAAHVVENDRTPTVSFVKNPKNSVSASVIARDPDHNEDGLALLYALAVESDVGIDTGVSFMTTATLAQENAVSLIGMPKFAGDWTLLDGTIVNFRGEEKLVIDAKVDEGNSGGPVFAQGVPIVGTASIIGLVIQTSPGFALALRAEMVEAFLAKHLSDTLFRVKLHTNVNSIYERELPGIWKYSYNGSPNIDLYRIFYREGILYLEMADKIYAHMGVISDVRLKGNAFSFWRGRGFARLERRSPTVFEGTFRDARGEAKYSMEKIGDVEASDNLPSNSSSQLVR